MGFIGAAVAEMDQVNQEGKNPRSVTEEVLVPIAVKVY
jgi:hypothetical protein